MLDMLLCMSACIQGQQYGLRVLSAVEPLRYVKFCGLTLQNAAALTWIVSHNMLLQEVLCWSGRMQRQADGQIKKAIVDPNRVNKDTKIKSVLV